MTDISALKAAAPRDLRTLFADDPDRFSRFSRRLGDMLLDLSKSALADEDLAALLAHAREIRLEAKRDAMLAGRPINESENRAVLHVALRGRIGDGYKDASGRPVGDEVEGVLKAMTAFASGVREGSVASSDGRPFTDVVNIGIGGSDLGPAMATLALAPYHDGPRLHYVSNVDGAHIADTLKRLDPARTLVVVASKTFTTIETMINAGTARAWIAGALGEAAVGGHFCAVSTALDKVAAFGIDEARAFGFWDWVGGRYSLWSAIGLPIMIAVGPENFRAMLSGARDMDQHFADAPLETNLPVLLGLVGWWNRAVRGCATRAVIPYDQRLSRLPAYLQQLDMESNGKSVDTQGRPVSVSGPVVWGEPGTNGQHAFFQLLHQGTDVVPVEFIVGARSHEPDLQVHQDLLIANCLAQSEALMKGRTAEEAKRQLLDAGRSEADADRIAPFRAFAGNKPSLTILYRLLDPATLGRLVALYEHRVFVEAQLFGINAFDQWGVELGKELASQLVPLVAGEGDADGKDASTRGLLQAIKTMRT